MKQWRLYERIVASIISQENSSDSSLTVTPNAQVKGQISLRKRQIDVLVDFRYKSDLSRRVIFDAKDRKRPIDVKDVESFEGMMKDVGASKGFIICTSGHTSSALRRAQQHIGIRLLTIDEAEELNFNTWQRCQSEKCENGLIMWDFFPSIIYNDIATTHGVAKCDECGLFQIWCWGCGNRKSLSKEDDWQCNCKEPWFWITFIEVEEEKGVKSKFNYLAIVFGSGQNQIIDRRPV